MHIQEERGGNKFPFFQVQKCRNVTVILDGMISQAGFALLKMHTETKMS